MFEKFKLWEAEHDRETTTYPEFSADSVQLSRLGEGIYYLKKLIALFQWRMEACQEDEAMQARELAKALRETPGPSAPEASPSRQAPPADPPETSPARQVKEPAPGSPTEADPVIETAQPSSGQVLPTDTNPTPGTVMPPAASEQKQRDVPAPLSGQLGLGKWTDEMLHEAELIIGALRGGEPESALGRAIRDSLSRW